MLAPDSHFVCLISLQSYWETITSESMEFNGWQDNINLLFFLIIVLSYYFLRLVNVNCYLSCLR